MRLSTRWRIPPRGASEEPSTYREFGALACERSFMSHPAQNVFAKRSQRIDHEDFLTLFETSSTKDERIISHSHSSPPGFWYDQNWDEWVIVMRGSATLEFEGNALVELKQGDYVTIAKHVKHRVANTAPENGVVRAASQCRKKARQGSRLKIGV